MLLCLNLTATTAQLFAGTLTCPSSACAGTLRPWGHARPRRLRDGHSYRPRRGRCRSCTRTQVIGWSNSYPRRVDHVNIVGEALQAAARGHGYRRVAEIVDRPASTVRDWIHRARRNSEPVRVGATVYTYALDPVAYQFDPTGTTLGDMLDAVGRAVQARALRFGSPDAGIWQRVLVLTRGAILAPVHRRIVS